MRIGHDKKGLDRDSCSANHSPAYISVDNSRKPRGQTFDLRISSQGNSGNAYHDSSWIDPLSVQLDEQKSRAA